MASAGAFAGHISIFEVPTSMKDLQNLKENMVEEREDREAERKEEKEKLERLAEVRRWEEERERRRKWEEEKDREERHDARRRREDRDDRRRSDRDDDRRSGRRSRSPRDAFPEVRNRLPRFFQQCLTVN